MSEPRNFRRLGLVVALVAPLAAIVSGATQTAPDPERVLSERFQFSPEDLALARSGQPVARMMIASGARDELAVMGALRLDGDKQRLVDWVTNIQQFRHAAELGLTRAIGSPPALEAFADLSLDAKDLAALQACRPGRCDLRLPDDVIAKFQSDVPWGTADAPARANAQAAAMLVGYAQAYLRGGDAALGNEFGELLRGATTLNALAPEFATYLERFPASTLAGIDQRLYWTNMTEGSESIISLHHLVVLRRPAGDVLIADKTIYASRYFDVAALVLVDAGDRRRQGLLPDCGQPSQVVEAHWRRRPRPARASGAVGRSTVKMYLEWVRDSLNAR